MLGTVLDLDLCLRQQTQILRSRFVFEKREKGQVSKMAKGTEKPEVMGALP